MVWQVRRMHMRDLPRVFALQREAYQSLVETDATITSRLALAPDHCWVAEAHDDVGAYLLTHPWPHPLPPAWNEPLTHLPRHATRLYIHDLALGQAARGSGIARRLIHTVLQQARRQHFHECQLIAVQSSKAFWQRFGFDEINAHGALKAKIDSYGSDACLMGMHIRR